MGNWNSGRRPNPARLQMLRGKKPGNPAEPQPEPAPVSFDTPPTELSNDAEATAMWQRTVPQLRVIGIITTADKPALIAMCAEWSKWMAAQKDIKDRGMLVQDRHGILVRNPSIPIADAAMKQCIRLWSELGLTPSARTKLSTGAGGSQSPASKWGTDL